MARLLILLLAASLAASASCLPVLAPVTKDVATSLYTLPFHDGATLVLDLAGPLLWSTCQIAQQPPEILCGTPTCRLANAYPAPGCRAPGCGHGDKTCTAYPYNPVTGACAPGNLAHTSFAANTTDGNNPVSDVTVRVVAACAPRNLLASLPRGSTGVAGLADSAMALPAQVASAEKVANKFLLCLPRGAGANGIAIFGGGPLPWPQYTQSMSYTPLVAKAGSPAHYISVKSITVENTRVPAAERALATGGVMLSTRVPYTLLRRDVYRPVMDAFAKALAAQPARGAPVARAVKPVAPFELCYDTKSLGNTPFGYWVPNVGLALDGGSDWAMTGMNSMVDVKPGTACVGFVEMKGVEAGDGSAPAMIVGGLQMESVVLEFDMEKKRFGFLRLPYYTDCTSFNFTRSA